MKRALNAGGLIAAVAVIAVLVGVALGSVVQMRAELDRAIKARDTLAGLVEAMQEDLDQEGIEPSVPPVEEIVPEADPVAIPRDGRDVPCLSQPGGCDAAMRAMVEALLPPAIRGELPAYFAANPPPAGKDGRDGTNGKDGTAGKDGSNGKDGTNGANGKDGPPVAGWTEPDGSVCTDPDGDLFYTCEAPTTTTTTPGGA